VRCMPSITKRAVPPHLPAMLDDREQDVDVAAQVAVRRRDQARRRRWLRPTLRAARHAGLGVLMAMLALAGLATIALLVVSNLGPSAGAAGGCGGG
jgi:hypothetical protein